VSSFDAGIFASPDGGCHWEAMNEGLPTSSTTALCAGPAGSDTLYAGTTLGVCSYYLVPSPRVVGPSRNACGTITASLSTQGYLAFQWCRDGAPLDGATAQSYVSAQSETYIVAVTDVNGSRGTSHGWNVAIQDCTDEVSGVSSPFRARLVPDASSSSGFYLYFAKTAYAVGYSYYEGSLSSLRSGAYDHGSAPHCNIAASDLGTGEVRAELAPSDGDHYYLVTAHSATVESPSGHNGVGQEIAPLQSTCEL